MPLTKGMFSKEKKFIATSLLLSLGFIGINFIPDVYRLVGIAGLTIATLIFFTVSLWEGLGINSTLLSLILPPLFTLGVGIFWFLIPASVFAQLPVVLFYGLGIYVLARTENVFTVSAVRTIPLFRSARWIGFILTFLTAFLLFDAIISVRANIFITALGVTIISFFLFLQGLWVSSLERKDLKKIMEKVFLYSIIFAFILAQISIFLYFWPVTVVVGSIFLTIAIYILLGLGQAQLEDRLFKQTVQEYLTIGLIVFVIMFLATNWA